jgi:hypothetical protein
MVGAPQVLDGVPDVERHMLRDHDGFHAGRMRVVMLGWFTLSVTSPHYQPLGVANAEVLPTLGHLLRGKAQLWGL